MTRESDSLDRLHDDRAAQDTFTHSSTGTDRYLVIRDENGLQIIPLPINESR